MKPMKRRDFMGICGGGLAGAAMVAAAGDGQAAEAPAIPVGKPAFVSGREDGRFVDTAGFMQGYMKGNPPKLAFDPTMPAEAFPVWRDRIREKMLELLVFPEVDEQPPPKQVWAEPRDGYQLQKWEAYPEPYCVVPFLMLVPDGVSAQSPGPAVMCFPGSGRSKENLAGEPELDGSKPKAGEEWKWRDNRMALHFVKQGIVAVAVDNPARCEAASPTRNFLDVTACAIWTGRNYLGISVFQKAHILEWLAEQPHVDRGRIATCGHSLGSDPADALGVLYPDLVAAVIHNDFCCDWRERTIALNAYPGGLHHVVPGMYQWYDSPDLQASLAPRPLLFTEGGRGPQLSRIRAAYKLMGAEDNVRIYYYKKYATADLRPLDDDPIPEGLTMDEYFRYANVDAKYHCFRPKRAVPWLADVFGVETKDV
jgi:Abhydrolase family